MKAKFARLAAFMLPILLVVCVLVATPMEGSWAKGKPTDNVPPGQAKKTDQQPGSEPNSTVVPNNPKDHKVVVCLVPKGNPANAHFIWVDSSAWENSQMKKHGSWLWGPAGDGAPKPGTKCAPKAPPVKSTPTSVVTTVVATTTSGGGANATLTPTLTVLPGGNCPEVITQDEKLSSLTDIYKYLVDRLSGVVRVYNPVNTTSKLDTAAVNQRVDPDGSTCSAVYESDGFLRIHGLDGSNDRQLMFNKVPIVGEQPDWVVGQGDKIVFVNDGNLYVTDVNGKTLSALGVMCERPDVGPAGKWIACTSGGKLQFVSLAGVYFGQQTTEVDCLVPRWHPSGSGLACVTSDGGIKYVSGPDNVSMLYANGTDIVFDPMQTNAAVLTESHQSVLVQNVWTLANATSLSGQIIDTEGQRPEWFVPNAVFGDESDLVAKFK